MRKCSSNNYAAHETGNEMEKLDKIDHEVKKKPKTIPTNLNSEKKYSYVS